MNNVNDDTCMLQYIGMYEQLYALADLFAAKGYPWSELSFANLIELEKHLFLYSGDKMVLRNGIKRSLSIQDALRENLNNVKSKNVIEGAESNFNWYVEYFQRDPRMHSFDFFMFHSMLQGISVIPLENDASGTYCDNMYRAICDGWLVNRIGREWLQKRSLPVDKLSLSDTQVITFTKQLLPLGCVETETKASQLCTKQKSSVKNKNLVDLVGREDLRDVQVKGMKFNENKTKTKPNSGRKLAEMLSKPFQPKTIYGTELVYVQENLTITSTKNTESDKNKKALLVEKSKPLTGKRKKKIQEKTNKKHKSLKTSSSSSQLESEHNQKWHLITFLKFLDKRVELLIKKESEQIQQMNNEKFQEIERRMNRIEDSIRDVVKVANRNFTQVQKALNNTLDD